MDDPGKDQETSMTKNGWSPGDLGVTRANMRLSRTLNLKRGEGHAASCVILSVTKGPNDHPCVVICVYSVKGYQNRTKLCYLLTTQELGWTEQDLLTSAIT
jgi:hypothetical protein